MGLQGANSPRASDPDMVQHEDTPPGGIDCSQPLPSFVLSVHEKRHKAMSEPWRPVQGWSEQTGYQTVDRPPQHPVRAPCTVPTSFAADKSPRVDDEEHKHSDASLDPRGIYLNCGYEVFIVLQVSATDALFHLALRRGSTTFNMISVCIHTIPLTA